MSCHQTLRTWSFNVAKLVCSLSNDRRGNVFMIFAFSLIPLMAAVGAAVDYSQAARSRSHMLEASNVAALAAARIAQNYMNQNGFSSSAWPQAQVEAQTEMSQVFAANQASDENAKNVTPALTMALNSDGSVSATVTATGTSNTIFMRLVGINTVPLKTLATAKGGGFTYYQIVFVVDVSNSMGIGGTSGDITNLLNDKLIACAFACHDPNKYRSDTTSYYCRQNSTDSNCHTSGASYCPTLSYWQQVDGNATTGTGKNKTSKAQTDYNANCATSYGTTPFADKRLLARQFGYKLKIDYVNSAISSFVSQLTPYMNAASTKNLFSVSMWTFGTTIKQIQSATNDPSTLASTSSTIDLEGAVPSNQNYGYTYTTKALQQAMAGTPNMGDGTSATKRKTYFILLSDGAEDVPGNSNWGRVVDVNYAATCTTLKQPVDPTNPNSNPIIFSIEAAYPPISPDTDGQYTALILNKGLNTQIPSTMKACASSSDDYFLASDGPAIQSAVSQVFSNIIGGNLHLTQ